MKSVLYIYLIQVPFVDRNQVPAISKRSSLDLEVAQVAPACGI